MFRRKPNKYATLPAPSEHGTYWLDPDLKTGSPAVFRAADESTVAGKVLTQLRGRQAGKFFASTGALGPGVLFERVLRDGEHVPVIMYFDAPEDALAAIRAALNL